MIVTIMHDEFLLIYIYISQCVQITRLKVIIAKIVIDMCPTNLTGDQRCCPVINDGRVNDFAAPTALNNSMSHFRHMQFFSLSSWRYTACGHAISFLHCDTMYFRARVCLQRLTLIPLTLSSTKTYIFFS